MSLESKDHVLLDALTEERWALRAMAGADALDARHVVLLASQRDGAAPAAMTWADRFAQAAGLRLRIAYHPPGEADAVNAAPSDRSAIDEAVERILAEAAQPGVELLIAGTLPVAAGTAQAALAQALLRRCCRPLLFVGAPSEQPLVMAATDCSDPALPVLRAAWQMAAVLGNQIVLVHNIDQTGSQFAERIGMPLSPELADVLALRSREWLESAAAISDIVITRDVDNAHGVLSAADRLDAGLLVVGVKPADQAPHGTAVQVLLRARRSVLFVPLARAGRHVTDPSGTAQN